MVVEVRIPSLGVAIQEVKIARILKEVGEKVEKGEVLAEVESEKVSFEVYAPEEGVVLQLNAREGEMIEVGSVLALLGTQENLTEAKVESATISLSSKPRIYPAARRLLEEYGIDISQVTPTGPDGVITKEDVLRAVEKTRTAIPAAAKPAAEDQMVIMGEEEIIPFAGMRKAIAEHMSRSKQTAAHVTTVAEVDMTEVVDLRRKIVATLGDNYKDKISYVTFVAKAVASAIKEFPIVNSVLDGDRIVLKKYVNVGIAVALEGGLVVPVIKNVDKKSFLKVDEELTEMVEAARAGKLGPEAFKNGTITISNAGAFGAILATPIIHQPQSAIVWMGRITKRPVVVEDQIAIRQMMYLCLSYDHRVLDGAVAARFLQTVRKLLEQPLSLILLPA